MLEFIINYWWIILIIIAFLIVIGYVFYTFCKMPNSKQLAKLSEWLLWAVAQAEKELGSGTGQLKLRYVYDMFLARFTKLSTVISFEAFSLLVDEVLEKFRGLLESNTNIQDFIDK